MGNIHDLQILSWVKEVDGYNIRPSALYTGSGTDTYLFGEHTENFNMPSPKPILNEIPTYDSYDVSALEQDKIVMEGQIPFTMKNGIELTEEQYRELLRNTVNIRGDFIDY